MFKNTKRPVQSYVVAKPDQSALATSTTLANSSTSVINLNNGQYAFMAASPYGSVAMNSFTDGTPTVAEAPVVALTQGNANSGSLMTATVKYPLSVRPYEQLQPMDGRKGNILVTKQAYTPATYTVWQVGTPAGTAAGAINITDDVNYGLTLAYRSRRHQIFYGNEQSATLRVVTPAVNFTDLGLSGDLARDYITTQLVLEINRNSQGLTGLGAVKRNLDPVVAFLVGLTTGGTAISALTAGSVVTATTVSGVNQTITLNAEQVTSLQAAATASGFDRLLTADATNAGTATGGTGTGIFVMGLDERTAYLDYISDVKINFDLGLNSAFATTVLKSKRSNPFEGQGYGAQLELNYQASQGQRKYFGRHRDIPVVNYPSDIDTAQKYVTYNIYYDDNQTLGFSHTSNIVHHGIALIPAYSSGTTTNAFIATFDTALNGWLTSGGNSSIVTL